MWIPLALLAAYRAWRHMDNLTVAKADFGSSAAAAKPPAHLGDVVPLHRHLRLVHRLRRGLPAAHQGPVPRRRRRRRTRSSGRSSARWCGRSADGWPTGSAAPGSPRSATSRWGSASSASSVRSSSHSFPVFLACFMVLFVATGVGNGSTYRMIPAIFRARGRPGRPGRGPHVPARGGRRDRHHLRGRRLRRLPRPAHLRLVDRGLRLDRARPLRLRRPLRRHARRHLGLLPAARGARWPARGSDDP